MHATFAIVTFIAIMLAGPDTKQVELTTPMKEVIVVARQDDGGWTLTEKPNHDKGSVRIDGQTFTHTGKNGDKSYDMAEVIGAGKDTDWAKAESFKWGANTVTIKRTDAKHADIAFTFGGDDHGAGSTITYKAAW